MKNVVECRCHWCGAAFTPRTGGRQQRFCSAQHRRQFHTAARQYVDDEIAAGRLTVNRLYSPRATSALPGAGIGGGGSEGAETPDEAPAETSRWIKPNQR